MSRTPFQRVDCQSGTELETGLKTEVGTELATITH